MVILRREETSANYFLRPSVISVIAPIFQIFEITAAVPSNNMYNPRKKTGGFYVNVILAKY